MARGQSGPAILLRGKDVPMSPRRLLPVVLIVLSLAVPAVAGTAPPGKGAPVAASSWDAAMAQIGAVLARFLPSPVRPPVTPDCTSGMDPNGRCI